MRREVICTAGTLLSDIPTGIVIEGRDHARNWSGTICFSSFHFYPQQKPNNWIIGEERITHFYSLGEIGRSELKKKKQTISLLHETKSIYNFLQLYWTCSLWFIASAVKSIINKNSLHLLCKNFYIWSTNDNFYWDTE